MSLVEEAMRKMRQSRQGGEGSQDGVFGALVSTGTHNTVAHPNFRAPVSDRIIAINEPALRNAGLLPPEHQERQLSQQYRQIKRPLIGSAFGRGVPQLPQGQLIMMASAVPGEGKTFTCLNLAFSMAREKDLRVLLVDADLPKPHISKLLGVDAERGLLDALQNHALDAESLILPTDVHGLSVLPAGQRDEHATELLASDRMRHIVARLLERDPQRIVLFDSPPLLLTTESQVLAQIVGQVVLVVRAGVTPHRTVLDAISYIGSDKSVSLVLNQSTAAPGSGYYYYGYGESQASEHKT